VLCSGKTRLHLLQNETFQTVYVCLWYLKQIFAKKKWSKKSLLSQRTALFSSIQNSIGGPLSTFHIFLKSHANKNECMKISSW